MSNLSSLSAEHNLPGQNKELELISEISVASATIFDDMELLQTAADMIRTKFALHNIYIYLFSADENTLNLVAAAGKTGQAILSQGRTISVAYGRSSLVQVIQTGQGLILNDLQQNSDRLTDPLLVDVCSELFVPMTAGATVFGVLHAQSDKADNFTPGDLGVYTVLATQVVVAVENIRRLQKERSLTSKIETQATHLTLLNELAQTLTARLTVDSVVEQIYRGASSLLDTTTFYITLFNQKTNQIDFALFAVDGTVKKSFAGRTADQDGLIEYLITTREPLLIKDKMTKRLAELGIRRILLIPDKVALSWLGVPMILGGRVIGTLTVMSYTKTAAFTLYDQELLVAIARQAAIAIENARQFEEAQNRVRREQIMREVTAQIRSAADVDSVMRLAVQGIGQALGGRTFIKLNKDTAQPIDNPIQQGK